MSVRTNSMTHYESAASQALALEGAKRGLALEMYEGTCALIEENKEATTEELLKAFDNNVEAAEAVHKAEVPDGLTLSEYCGNWKKTKSQTRKALKGLGAGFSKCKSLNDALTKLSGGKGSKGSANPDNSGKAGDPSGGGGVTDSNNVVSLPKSADQFSESVRDKVNLFIKHLAQLDEASQMQVINGAEGAIGRLRKAGGRHANARKTGS